MSKFPFHSSKWCEALLYLCWNLPLQSAGKRQAFVHVSFAVSLLRIAEMETVCCQDILHRQNNAAEVIHKLWFVGLELKQTPALIIHLPHVSNNWCISPRMLSIYTHFSIWIRDQCERLVKPPVRKERTKEKQLKRWCIHNRRTPCDSPVYLS